jgi:probable HAF family extracellular repeat protein
MKLAAAFAGLSLIALAACSGGGTRTVPPALSTTTGSPRTATATLALNASGGTQTLPPVGGVSTTVVLPANTAPGGTVLYVTVSTGQPAGMPPIPASSSSAFVYYTFTASNDVTLNSAPSFNVTLSNAPQNHGNFYAWSYGAAQGWYDWGSVSVSGAVIRFGGSARALSLKKGAQLLIVPFTAQVGASCPTPSPPPPPPSPSPSPTAAPTFPPASVPHFTSVSLPQHFEPNQINDNGVIAGNYLDPKSGSRLPAMYKNGQLQLLPMLPGSYQGLANGINDKGQIVGAAFFTDGSSEAVLYSDGHVYGLHAVGEALSINERSIIAGFVLGSFGERAVLFDASTCEPISFPLSGSQYTFSVANRINDSGNYVGEFETSSNPNRQPYIGNGLTIVALSFDGDALDINSDGDIVGDIGPINGPPIPFIRDHATGALKFPLLPGYPHGRAVGINDLGEVVGDAYGNTYSGFVYENGMIGSMQEVAGNALLEPLDVNNKGQIIAYDNSVVPDHGFPPAVLLTPRK